MKCVDALLNRLDVENREYPLSYLTRLQPTRVNVAQCRLNSALVDRLNAKAKQSRLTAAEKAQRRAALVYNNAVDIHALTCWYTDFLHEKVGINNVANATSLVSCHNVPGMANAFFTGEFMVYGNGAEDADPRFALDPMGAVDICGHELGHGIVQALAGLIYQGHAGALNESFADVFGISFEFWLYIRQNKLKGGPDWLLGEDVGTPLRNMLDPTAAAFPQPAVYRGTYWANPNSTADYGGVHTNSGVGNRCYSHRATVGGLDATLAIFVAALRKLKPKASYLDYRDALKAAATAARVDMSQSLGAVGLTDAAVSDWRPPA